LPIGFQRFTQEKEAGRIVCNGQRITIPFIAKLKLTLVIGAPKIVGVQSIGQGRAFGSTAAPTHGLDQPMPIQHRVNGRGSGSLDGMRQAPQETLADLARPSEASLRLALTMAASTCSGNWLA